MSASGTEDRRQPTPRVFGIDFGNTASSISYIDERGIPVVIPSEQQSFRLPSVVYYESADQVIVGEDAKRSMKINPEFGVELIKQHLGDKSWSVNIHGKERTAEEISAIILKKLADLAEQHTGEKVTDVVITVPAYFDSAKREATQTAGVLAGFNVHELVPEPTAAAIAYETSSHENQTILVYDLGGGTFDTTVINISDTDIEVVCTGGDAKLGGRLWDERIHEYLQEAWAQGGQDISDLDDPVFNYELADAAESIKVSLSSEDGVRHFIQYSTNRMQVEITREDFEDLTSDLLERTMFYTKNTLDIAAAKGFGEISQIILVGGSTYMPQVKRTLDERFGLPSRLFEAELAVVKGAAILGNDLKV